MSNSKVQGRGRPAIFKGAFEKAIVRVIKRKGLTGARAFLAETGVQSKPGAAVATVKISMPTLAKLAHRNGLTLKRGRPVTKVAA